MIFDTPEMEGQLNSVEAPYQRVWAIERVFHTLENVSDISASIEQQNRFEQQATEQIEVPNNVIPVNFPEKRRETVTETADDDRLLQARWAVDRAHQKGVDNVQEAA